jgi:hypothetical protein
LYTSVIAASATIPVFFVQLYTSVIAASATIPVFFIQLYTSVIAALATIPVFFIQLYTSVIAASATILPSLAPFGPAVSEEKIFLTLANQKQELPLAAIFVGELKKNVTRQTWRVLFHLGE